MSLNHTILSPTAVPCAFYHRLVPEELGRERYFASIV